MKITLPTLLLSFLNLIVPATCLVSLLSYFGQLYYLLDNASNFRPQLLCMGFILLLISIILSYTTKKHYWNVLCTIFTVIINLYAMLPYFHQVNNLINDNDGNVKVMLSNVMADNTQYDLLINLVKKEDPDFLFLQETSPNWVKQLQSLNKIYKYHVNYFPRIVFSDSVYSKKPMINLNTGYFQYKEAILTYIIFDSFINNQKVRFIAIHPTPPSNERMFFLRNLEFDLISKRIQQSNLPCVLVGDLNVSPFSIYFNDLLRKTKLINPRKDFGLNLTWPVDRLFPFGTSLDHILYSKDLKTVEFRTGSSIGSDHLPVFAKINIVRK